MIELIPAIDIIDGKCVRLTKGDYDTKKVYDASPADVAREMEDYGFRRLHIVDLDGARSRHVVNHRVLHEITSSTKLKVDFGGGIKTDEDLRIAFDNGAALATIGSIAVTHPEVLIGWLQRYGSERIILGADVRDKMVSINGWKEDSALELIPFLERYTAEGVTNVLCTDIACDGMLQGPSTTLYSEVMAAFPTLHLIASGGVSSTDDLRRLSAAGIPAAVFGKAIYEGRIDLKKLVEEFPQK